MIKIISIVFFVIIGHFVQAQADTITQTATGMHNGYFYELWEDISSSGGILTLKEDEGAFEFTWESGNNTESFAGTGRKQGTGEELIEFAAEIESDGNAYLATSGFFIKTGESAISYNILAQFSIIEYTLGWDMSSYYETLDSIYSDGSYYTICRTLMQKNSTFGSYSYFHYYFVRKNNRTEGTVTFNNHYNKLLQVFEDNNQSGYLHQILFGVETYMSGGYCNMYKLTFGSGFPEDPTVEFTSIQDNHEFSIGEEVSISANVSAKQGTIEKVEYFAANKKIGETTQTPHEILWLPDSSGSIPITIIATDTEGWDTKTTTIVIVKDEKAENLAIKLSKGWNIIGYVKNPAPIENALASIWENVEEIKDLDSFYLKGIDAELNSLKELSIGKGYLIKVSEDCSLEW